MAKFIRDRIEPYYRKWLRRVFDSFPGVLSAKTEERIITGCIWFANLVADVTMVVVSYWIFVSRLLPKWGFEKTVVVLLVVIAWLVRAAMERVRDS
jgi:hypothetical protein